MNNEKEQIFEQLCELWTAFEANHKAPTKSSDAKARKALGDIKKLVTNYRKASVESNK